MTDSIARPVTIGPRVLARRALSRTQRLIWASQRLAADRPVANMGDRLRIRGEIDPDRFAAAFDAVVRHAEALRLVVDADGVHAHVLASPPSSTELIDLPLDRLDDWSAERISAPIDATRCVYDSVLIRHASDDWTWWIDIHHVATDAWSAALVVQATAAAYASAGDPRDADLDAMLGRAYFDHVDATLDADADAVAERASEWAKLASPEASAPLDMFGGRGPRTTEVERLTVPVEGWRNELETALGGVYRSFSRELSLLALAASAAIVTAHRLDGRTSLVVGVPVHHRSGRDAARVVGPLMELYPLVVTFDPDETHRELVDRTLQSIIELLRRARPGESPDVPFEVVVNVTTAQYGDVAGMRVRREWMRSGHVDANHLLRVQIFDRFDPDTDGRAIDWELDVNRSSGADGNHHRHLPARYAAVARGFVSSPDERAGRVSILDDDDRRALATLNPDPRPQQLGAPVHEQIRNALRADPTWVVAEEAGIELLAADFDRRADALASWLVSSGLTVGRTVGLRMARGLDVLVAIHGVLRAGGCFVLLDPDDPAVRHDRIAADADLFTIIDALPAVADAVDPTPSLPTVSLDDRAYVLYTSGSTGEPKGVPISHRGLADYLAFAIGAYCAPGSGTESPVIALHSSLVFDLTVTSLFLSFLTGGRIVVRPEDPVDALGRIATDPRITFLKATPSQLEILARLTDEPMPLRTVVVGGEAFRRPVAERLRHGCVDGVRIFNEYGPTEAVVGCMIHEYDSLVDVGPDVPIGHAAPGSQLLVLDPLGELSPPGSWGELYVRRPGMAAGYLNRPALTAERFVACDLSDADRRVLGRGGPDGGNWYRTGDRVRVERGGVLVFGGRHDDQVKVNGIRLEPAEVEAALVRHPGIDTALVRVWHPSDGLGEHLTRCARCGLGTDVPGVDIDHDGVCSVCHRFDAVEHQTQRWFRAESDLDLDLERARSRATGSYDCLHLLSGGKDSTYALYQLVERGWRVHALTLDNGFISDGAKENIRRSVADLGITHEFATTDAMNAIFRDSLERHANVCQGCYKTIYTLAVARADELGIPVVVTGLSRGQFFETRLVPHQFEEGRFDPDAIDRTVLEARKVYHHTDDAVTRLLPEQRVFDDDTIFERVEFLDFYRYVDVELAEMYDFLERRAPWVRPADTGRSTNCLINVAGIHVHRTERGFHNYAEPYSWDVRLGHKTRDEALDELDDEIDPAEVDRLLGVVGYQPQTHGVLTAWYQASDPSDVDPDELRAFLRRRLPEHAVPSAFVRVDEMPLAASAKADPSLLPPPTRFHRRSGEGIHADTDTEERIASIWCDVLGIDSVGVTDDFFDLGGVSLAALDVVARIDAEFGTDLPDASVFRARTIRELAQRVDAERGPPTSSGPTRAAIDPARPLPLSAGEEAMLFEYRADPADTRYNITRRYELRSLERDATVDVGRFEAAVRAVVMGHAPLHTTFSADRTTLSVDAAVEFVDLGERTADDVERFARAQRAVPFDLDEGPLVRVHVARTDGALVALLGLPHIVVDAGTFDTLWRQIADRAAGEVVPELELTYAEHTQGQAARDDAASGEFWADQARRREPAARLALAPPSPVEPDGYLERRSDLTSRELGSAGGTPFAAALASAGSVVATFAASPAVEVGITTSTKDHPATAPIVGYYLNTLPASMSIDPTEPFEQLAARVAGDVADALEHRCYPFASIVRDARRAGLPPPDVSVMVAYERLERPEYPGATVSHEILASGTSVADVTFFLQERDGEVRLGIEYRGSVVSRRDAARLLDAYAGVLEQGLRAPTRTIDDLTGAFRSNDLVGAPLRPAGSVLSRIVEQMRQRPDASAVADGEGDSLTYSELATAVAHVASTVETAHPYAPQRIGVSIRRSTDLLVALLGAQFAGAAYVALDPTVPEARLRLVADGADLDLLITDDPSRTLGVDLDRVVPFAVPSGGPSTEQALVDLERRAALVGDDDPAYVVFTSGSTGRPRGVVVSHANLAASTAARDVWFDRPPARFLMTSSPGFDSSIVGVFWPIVTGGTVVLPTDDDVRDVDRLAQLVADRAITHTLMVPGLSGALLTRSPRSLAGLEVSIVAGEACPASVAAQHLAALPGVALVNEYGPTEATVWATAHAVTSGAGPVPIGRPIPGTTVRIADPTSLRPTPAGVAGELLIAGPGVTAGYLDDPDTTTSRFVEADGARWYRTGDLVRLVDDDVHFLGRLDDQLNVGGARVEPGEIERELDAIPGIVASVVVAAGQPPALVAHLEVADPDAIDEAELRERLAERLPATSIPRRFVGHRELPRSAHGKLDRTAVQNMVVPVHAPEPAPRAVAHSSALDLVLAAWRTALAPAPIESDTDFFAAGGDSLTAVEVVSALGARLGVEVPIAALLAGRTPDGMVAVLGDELGAVEEPLVHPVWFRNGVPDGPLIVMTPTWDDVFGYQALAESFPEHVGVVALAYEPAPGGRSIVTVPDMVAAMRRALASIGLDGRPLAVLGWSIGGVSAVELAAQLRSDDEPVDLAVVVDTFYPGEERHLWSNRWWKYRSMIRPGAFPELRRELRRFALGRARRIADRAGRRLLAWSGTEVPTATAGPRLVGSFPAEAFGHQPTPPGVPLVVYRASTTNPARTIRRWRQLASDVDDVVVPGRHRGFDSIMRADKARRISTDVVARLAGRSASPR